MCSWTKLCEPSGKRARMAVEEEFGVPISDDLETQLGKLLGPVVGSNYWESIVQFMAGARPSQVPADRKEQPGSEKNASRSFIRASTPYPRSARFSGRPIRRRLPFGTIRREFGQTIMVNAAHASDSVENALREMDIIRVSENNLKPIIESHLS